MSSPTFSLSPSTVVSESSIASRSPPHSWFSEGDVSTISLDKGKTNVAGLGSKYNKVGKSSENFSCLLNVFVISYHYDFSADLYPVVEPMRACRNSRKGLYSFQPHLSWPCLVRLFVITSPISISECPCSPIPSSVNHKSKFER